MKRTLFLLFVLAVLGAGAFYYFKNYNQKTIDSWILVPSSAIIAFENKSFVENWNVIVEKPIWNTFQKIPYFRNWEETLAEADSISGKNGAIDRLFRNKPLIISIHITASNQFDFLFNLNLGEKGEVIFRDVMRSLQKDRSIVKKTRTYQGIELSELTVKNSKSVFTYFVYKKVV